MANQKIGSRPDRNVRATGSTSGWQEANRPNQSDMNQGRESRAAPEASKLNSVTQDGNR